LYPSRDIHLGAREMAVEGTTGALEVLIRVDVQHNARNVAPVGKFRVGIQHPHVSDGVLLVVRSEGALGGSNVGNVRVEWRHGFLAVSSTRPIIRKPCDTLVTGGQSVLMRPVPDSAKAG
jgi:hypothetical protein